MSRVRLAYILGLLGILITTGGCAESATAPEATFGAAAPSETTLIGTEPTELAPASEEETGTVTIQTGTHIAGGGRSEEP